MMNFKLLILFFFCLPLVVVSQQRSPLKFLIAKVIEIDGKDVFDNEFAVSAARVDSRYHYAIQHFMVVDEKKDTSVIAYVFNTKDQMEKLSKNFDILCDSIYRFSLYDLYPCNSDFPALLGCEDKYTYVPHKKSIVKTPYKTITRIIDFVPIQLSVWKELCSLYD
jgi:hypothetical protein